MKTYKIGLAVALSLGLGFASTSIMGNDTLEASKVKEVKGGVTIHEKAQEVASAKKETPFKVKLPKDLPIKFEKENATSSKISDDTTVFTANYFGEDNNLLSVTVLNSNLKIVNDTGATEKTVELSNGKEALFVESNGVKSLSWSEDELSYEIKYMSKLPSDAAVSTLAQSEVELDANNLVDIANSMEEK
jgi:hypothetical protein